MNVAEEFGLWYLVFFIWDSGMFFLDGCYCVEFVIGILSLYDLFPKLFFLFLEFIRRLPLIMLSILFVSLRIDKTQCDWAIFCVQFYEVPSGKIPPNFKIYISTTFSGFQIKQRHTFPPTRGDLKHPVRRRTWTIPSLLTAGVRLSATFYLFKQYYCIYGSQEIDPDSRICAMQGDL